MNDYKIIRGITLNKVGRYDVWYNGEICCTRYYTKGNTLSRIYAYQAAKEWIKQQLK